MLHFTWIHNRWNLGNRWIPINPTTHPIICLMITWGGPNTPDFFPFKEEIYSNTQVVVKQEQDEMRISKSDGACFVSPLSRRPAWPSSPLPSESLSLWLSSCLTTSAAICAPPPPLRFLQKFRDWASVATVCSLITHSLAFLLFHSQIQGMTALPPDIERPYKAEPLMCPSSSSSLHTSLSLQLLVCFTGLGSILSRLHSWS